MKERIEAYLSENGNWKKFVSADEIAAPVVIGINVTTFQLDEGKVYFDVSIIYKYDTSGQKQSYESGVAILDEKGNIIEVGELAA